MVEEGTSKVDFVGNRTECALLVMVRNWGQDYRQLRDINHENTVGELAGGRKQSASLLHPCACHSPHHQCPLPASSPPAAVRHSCLTQLLTLLLCPRCRGVWVLV
jgi:hypothetical protein